MTFPLAWKNLYMTGIISPALRICDCLESFVRQSKIKNTGLFLHWELSLNHWFYLIHETALSIIHGDIFNVWFYYFILSYNQNISYQSHTPQAFFLALDSWYFYPSLRKEIILITQEDHIQILGPLIVITESPNVKDMSMTLGMWPSLSEMLIHIVRPLSGRHTSGTRGNTASSLIGIWT